MTISIKSRKAKARSLQNLIAKKIAEITGRPFGKDMEIQGREMGQSGEDVKLYGKALELFPFSIEAKNSEKWDVHSAIKQAKSNTKDGLDWLCVFKRNREDPVVMMCMSTFFRIYNTYLRMQEMLNKEIK